MVTRRGYSGYVWKFAGDALVMVCWHVDYALVISRWYFYDLLVMRWRCSNAMRWICLGDASVMCLAMFQ